MILYTLHFTAYTISGKENGIFIHKQLENILEVYY